MAVDYKSYTYYTDSLRRRVWNLMKTFDVYEEDIPEAARAFQGMLNDIDTVESIVLADIEASEASDVLETKKTTKK